MSFSERLANLIGELDALTDAVEAKPLENQEEAYLLHRTLLRVVISASRAALAVFAHSKL